MRRAALFLAGLFALALVSATAAAEELISGLSQDRIQITSSYSGTDIVVFGAIENGGEPKGRDVVVVVRGPATDYTIRRKARVVGIWVNSDRVIVRGMPGYYYLAATRPLAQIAQPDTLDHYDIGLAHVKMRQSTAATPEKREIYRDAVLRAKERANLFHERGDGVEFLGKSLFRVRVPVPASAPRGEYEADVYLFRDGAMVSTQASPLFIEQAGLERRLFDFAHEFPLAYSVSAVVMSLLLGWLSSVVFRQNR